MEVSGGGLTKGAVGLEGFCGRPKGLEGHSADPSNLIGCWGPCYTMSSHAALGVVRAGVAVLKGTRDNVS